jgi:hypothetical protein
MAEAESPITKHQSPINNQSPMTEYPNEKANKSLFGY